MRSVMTAAAWIHAAAGHPAAAPDLALMTFYPSALAPAQATAMTRAHPARNRAGVDLQLRRRADVMPWCPERSCPRLLARPAWSRSGYAARRCARGEIAADALAPVGFSDGAGVVHLRGGPQAQCALRATGPVTAAGPNIALRIWFRRLTPWNRRRR